MNLPNRLTILRIVLIPFFVFFLLTNYFEYSKWVALIIFTAASLTDMADGKIARKKKLVTNFGKFMDPVADKLLVCSALICFVDMRRIPTWIVLIIIAREFIVSGFRLVASEQGVVLAAGIWGKFKTATQMVMIIVLIADLPGEPVYVIEQILIYASLVLTIFSMIDYLWTNRKLLLNGGI